LVNEIEYQDDAGSVPSEEQRAILRVALLEGPEAREAALAWLAKTDVARLGRASVRLLPLIYERFRREGIQHPVLPVLRGLKRHTWCRNRLLFDRASEAIRALHSAGIEVMVIKGVALTIEYYQDWSLRPMDDVDLLVRYPDARAAIEVLRGQGWKALALFVPEVKLRMQWNERKGFSEETRQYVHAMHFVHPSGQDLDLHWNLTPLCLGPDADRDFWAASKAITFEGQSVRVLDPADQLLHICVHGAAWESVAPIRWIPDALTVIRKAPQLDWKRLLLQARKRKLTLMVSSALDYIHRNIGDFVPAHVLAEFEGSDVTVFERLEYRELLRPASALGRVQRKVLTFLRVCQGNTLRHASLSFCYYLCTRLRVDRMRQVPAALCGEIWRRSGDGLRRRSQ
jgi:hypothetical protein